MSLFVVDRQVCKGAPKANLGRYCHRGGEAPRPRSRAQWALPSPTLLCGRFSRSHRAGILRRLPTNYLSFPVFRGWLLCGIGRAVRHRVPIPDRGVRLPYSASWRGVGRAARHLASNQDRRVRLSYSAFLRCRPTVGHWTLDPAIQVRILAPQ